MSASYILVVDDEPDIRDLVKEILEDEGYGVAIAENAAAAREARRAQRPDLILLDIWMPDTDGITLLKEWSEGDHLPCPVIMMSGHGTVETAVEATRLGAYDFIEKPLSMAKLLLTVERALDADRLARENQNLRRQQRIVTEPVGRSEVVQRLRAQVLKIAQHDAPVLVFGEPGTGKEVYARFLHAHSPRRNGPFVDVGVGSIARENASLELFGSEQGERIHYGRLEQASGGTLFLDELADMDLEAQAKLASALENGSFLRIGGKEPVRVNVRVAAATHRDLEQEVAIGRFREDLYYQLNVVPIKLPPLRDHIEDVPELLNYYIGYFVDQEGLTYRHFTSGGPESAAQLQLARQHPRTEEPGAAPADSGRRGGNHPGGSGCRRARHHHRQIPGCRQHSPEPAVARSAGTVRANLSDAAVPRMRGQRGAVGRAGRHGTHQPLPQAARPGHRSQEGAG
jgi:two-component system nitrogen regulation response regulator NtrX